MRATCASQSPRRRELLTQLGVTFRVIDVDVPELRAVQESPQEYVSRVAKVTVEQSGPVRAVVKIEGKHAALAGARQWLPFIVRLYFTAGLESVRMVHSFIFDGDQKTDFIKGLGLTFTVPFREEMQNRHIRFATDGDHLFSEPVLMAPGYRPRS